MTSKQAACGQTAVTPFDPTDELILAVMRTSRLSRTWEAVAGRGMSNAQIAILTRLCRDGKSRLTALAEAVALELSMASRQVNALVEAGAVVRERDPEDGRAWLIELAEPGRDALRAIERDRRQWFEQILAGISEDERAIAARVAAAINGAWEQEIARKVPLIADQREHVNKVE